MSGIIRTARAIMTLLGPMTGTSATGNVTVASTGATGTIPKNTYGSVVLNGETSRHVIVKTTAETEVTSAGTAVPVKTVLGSLASNCAAGSVVRWLPTPTGIAETATVAAPGLTGGTQADGYGYVKEIVFYEELKPGDAKGDIMRSLAGRFPAMVLCWQGSGEAEASGKQRDHVTESWSLFIITSRLQTHMTRAYEGLELVEEARERITRREVCDGELFTSPGPVHIRGSSRIATGADFYIYDVKFTTERTLSKRDPRSFATWELAQYDHSTEDAVPLPVVVDNTEDMTT